MRTLAIAILLILNSIFAHSCTTFVLKTDSELIFGRNLDWVSDNGLVVANKRNIQKSSLVFPPDLPTKWTSKYGSITFNQFGKELPFGGINETGLVIEIMLVPGDYPEFDNRTAINELQWIQYQLDNCETIEEVIASDGKIRISKIDKNIHFLVCDRFGNVAVIEFDKKGMIAYKGSDLPIPVLENDPYSESLNRNTAKENCRFNTAARLVERYNAKPQTSAIEYSFNILDKVALDGAWSIVYDVKNMEVQFKTASFRTIRKIRIHDFDFECEEKSKIYDMKLTDKGYINTLFIPYSGELNRRKFDDAIFRNGIQLPQAILNEFYVINTTCICSKE